MPPGNPDFTAWLDAMKARYDLRRTETVELDMSDPGGPPLDDRLYVFEFVPKPGAAVAAGPPVGLCGARASRPRHLALSRGTAGLIMPGYVRPAYRPYIG